jgi:hypothetical protein
MPEPPLGSEKPLQRCKTGLKAPATPRADADSNDGRPAILGPVRASQQKAAPAGFYLRARRRSLIGQRAIPRSVAIAVQCSCRRRAVTSHNEGRSFPPHHRGRTSRTRCREFGLRRIEPRLVEAAVRHRIVTFAPGFRSTGRCGHRRCITVTGADFRVIKDTTVPSGNLLRWKTQFAGPLWPEGLQGSNPE